jgi:hypothetical protein
VILFSGIRPQKSSLIHLYCELKAPNAARVV